jgi:hypothetical protein
LCDAHTAAARSSILALSMLPAPGRAQQVKEPLSLSVTNRTGHSPRQPFMAMLSGCTHCLASLAAGAYPLPGACGGGGRGLSPVFQHAETLQALGSLTNNAAMHPAVNAIGSAAHLCLPHTGCQGDPVPCHPPQAQSLHCSRGHPGLPSTNVTLCFSVGVPLWLLARTRALQATRAASEGSATALEPRQVPCHVPQAAAMQSLAFRCLAWMP